ncbi:cellular morphogenesis cytokinesis regulation protein [Tubulinosema ratisbonensis]|uniref:Cellular morphogenesis cytokinesis regulation protein n=1 Tax=Tubulinosema ratisbonensis TaxID=291195 RepID=A0A437AJI4_9MICR|nr:cellular morphogenesis cytokinesis regulation protein [Tubulinosema ratisbonensis]
MTTEDFYNKENYSSKISKDFNYTVPIDTMRTNTRIYEYLCCLEECNQFFYDNLPQKKRLSLEEFEEELSKGITLLQILSVITPVTKIHQEEVKSYKHMDNIVLCTQILTKLIPKFFNFEPIDLYERKNIPRVIYAIHALASIYAKCFDVKIKELFGKVNFDSTEISRVEKQIKENKINLKDKREIKNELKKEQDSEKISEFLHEVVKKEERKGNSKEIFEFIKLRSYQLAHRDIFKRKEPSIHTLRKVLPLFVRESVYVKKEKNLQESEITLKELKMHKLSLEEEIFKLKNKILVLSHNRNKSLEKIISLNSDTKKIQEIINLYLKDHSIKEIINYFNKIEIKLKKKEEEYWRCISVPQKYKEKKYLFDEYEKEDLKIDSLEKMMYCLYENGSKEMRRRMDQSFYESEGKELIASVKQKNKKDL